MRQIVEKNVKNAGKKQQIAQKSAKRMKSIRKYVSKTKYECEKMLANITEQATKITKKLGGNNGNKRQM